MKALLILLVIAASTPERDPGVPTGQCDQDAVVVGYSCMPVIVRTRTLKPAI